MTCTLILTRHAKSSWDVPAQNDHSRPLNKRGRRSARAIGNWLSEKGLNPDQVLSSSSQRTRETWDLMGLKAPLVTYTDNLYHASANGMMNSLAEAREPVVLMLGHNPGISEFASEIVKQPPNHPRFYDYPTCATTVIRFDIDRWSDIHWHSGTVEAFILPRELLEK